MQVTYNNNVLDNIFIQLYYTADSLGNRDFTRLFSGYRTDYIAQFKDARVTNQTTLALGILRIIEHDADLKLGIAQEGFVPEGAFVGSQVTQGGITWMVFGSADSITSDGSLRRKLSFSRVKRIEIKNTMLAVTTEASEAEAEATLTFERNENIVIVRPTQTLLETIPAGARPFALHIATTAESGGGASFDVNFEGNVPTMARRPEVTSSQPRVDGVIPTAAHLLTEARAGYRTYLRATLNRPTYDAAEVAAREEARRRSAERFSAFARREADTEQHVGSLPFVPHGLSSSRRWGIEVESGGARGVNAPAHWTRTSDGSLRSAWAGYVEVQDFEPFDEEVTMYRPIGTCTNGRRHQYEVEVVDPETGRWVMRPNPDYLSPEGCDGCGNETRTVHRTPQTIRHEARNDDCAEFVSPILVSMHSQGLETLTEQLSKQPQNASAGVHVHVEASDLTDAQVAALIFGYDILEPLLEASYRREERRFCNRREADSVLSFARKLRPGGAGVTRDEVRGGNRYVTLNTNALNAHGTIEFRAMGPVYDYAYLTRWAMLCRELVNLAAAGVTVSQFSRIKSWNDLLMMLAEYGKEYVRAATYELTGETGHAADLVKQGADMTTEALDADLNMVLTGGAITINTDATSNLRRWANLIVGSMSGRSNADLVGVGSPSISNTWAV